MSLLRSKICTIYVILSMMCTHQFVVLSEQTSPYIHLWLRLHFLFPLIQEVYLMCLLNPFFRYFHLNYEKVLFVLLVLFLLCNCFNDEDASRFVTRILDIISNNFPNRIHLNYEYISLMVALLSFLKRLLWLSYC